MADDCPECPVCYDEIVVTTNRVECPGCDYTVCVKCCRDFILSTSNLPHCMECKVRWGKEFMYKTFTKSWVDGNKKGCYRFHHKNLLLDREKALLPETISKIQTENEDRKIKQEMIHELEERRMEVTRELNEIDAQIREIRQTKQTVEKNYNFVCPCPRPNCRGLIEKESFKCAVCEKGICRKCREPRDPPSIDKKKKKKDRHRCDPNTVENIKLIKDDTKPCPECAVPITKLSGCGQMWCPQCKYVYNWETGKKETGTVHNPHAVRWQREHGKLERDINDIPCGGLIGVYPILRWKIPDRILDKIEDVHRFTAEVIERFHPNNHPINTEYVRRRYIKNEISESKWKQAIFLRERESERKQVKADILTTFRTLLIERFRNLLETGIEKPRSRLKTAKEFLRDAEEIRVFINEAFEEMKMYGTQKPPYICKSWEWDMD